MPVQLAVMGGLVGGAGRGAGIVVTRCSRQLSSFPLAALLEPASSREAGPGMAAPLRAPLCPAPRPEPEFPPSQGGPGLLERCSRELRLLPRPLQRAWQRCSPQHTHTEDKEAGEVVRVMTWNLLAQAIGTGIDNFVLSDPAALDWEARRWRILEECLRYSPDLLCLQEVDCYPLLRAALGSAGYRGAWRAKPDSACNYVPGNTGPDGCALLYRRQTWDLVQADSRVLHSWGVPTNQVAVALCLRHRSSGREICVATTHLKARSGPLLAALRAEQGGDLLAWLDTVRAGRPLLLTGDFNAAPSEPVVDRVTESGLQSSYCLETTEFTSWKVRDTGEEKQVLDYIFHSADLSTVSVLEIPAAEEIGPGRLPSTQFCSDHLSLLADISLDTTQHM